MEAKFNFDMLKQKLEDQIKFANKELDETKKAKATAQAIDSRLHGIPGLFADWAMEGLSAALGMLVRRS